MLSVPSSANTVMPEEQAPASAAQPRRAARRKLWFFTALAVVAGAVGASALGANDHASPDVRSGSPGYRTNKSGKTLHWQRKAITVYLDDSLTRISPTASDAVAQAFGRWVESDQRLPDLSFDTGKTTSIPTQDGKSTVSYGRITAPGHERDLAITVTYANDDTGEIVEADIVVNSMYPLGVLTAKNKDDKDGKDGRDEDGKHDSGSSKTMNSEADDCRDRYDIQNVTTHEAGHFFGLGEDLVERGSTMFQTIDQCEVHKRALSTSDVGALTTLYAENEDPEEAAAGPRACSFVAGPSGSDSFWVSTLMLGLLAVRRHRQTRC